MEFMESMAMLLTIHWEKCVTYSAPIVFLFLHMWQNDFSLVSVVDQNIFRWILQVNFAQREEGWPPSHEACKKNCCLPPSCIICNIAQQDTTLLGPTMLRVVASVCTGLYRKFSRLLWDFAGHSERYPLPCCTYKAIRTAFPSENGQYYDFEDDES